MKMFKTTPENEEFFQTYISVSGSFKGISFLAQLVSAFTELIGIYVITIASLEGIAGPKWSTFGAITCAVIGTLAIEWTNFRFVPASIESFVHKARWKGDGLGMSVIILLTAICGLTMGATISFKGAKEIGETYLNNEEDQNQISSASDSTINLLYNDFRNDSILIVQSFQSDSISAAKISKSSIASFDREISAYRKKGRAENVSYLTKIEEAKIKKSEAEAVFYARIGEITKQRNELIKNLKDEFKTGKKISADESGTVIKELESETKSRAVYLGYITLIFNAIFLFVQFGAIKYEKGSGLKKVYHPHQNYFSQSWFSQLSTAIGQRVEGKIRWFLHSFENKTRQAPPPAGLTGLYNIGSIDRQIMPVKIEENEAKEIQASVKIPGLETSEKQVLQKVSAAEKERDEQKKNALRIGAKDVIAMYLRTSNMGEINTFYDKCKAFLEGTGSNPFGFNRIGFFTDNQANNALRYKLNENALSNQTGAKNKNCAHCGNNYLPNTTWQKFCSDECKNAAHQARHGGKKLIKGFNHQNMKKNKND